MIRVVRHVCSSAGWGRPSSLGLLLLVSATAIGRPGRRVRGRLAVVGRPAAFLFYFYGAACRLGSCISTTSSSLASPPPPPPVHHYVRPPRFSLVPYRLIAETLQPRKRERERERRGTGGKEKKKKKKKGTRSLFPYLLCRGLCC